MVKLTPVGKFWLIYLAILTIVILYFVDAFGQANNIQAQWDPNSEPDLAGYRIYWSQEQGSYGQAFDIPLVNYKPTPEWNNILTGWLQPGRWYFVATAYDTSGNESEFSDEAFVDVPDVAPGQPKTMTWQVTLPDGTVIQMQITTP